MKKNKILTLAIGWLLAFPAFAEETINDSEITVMPASQTPHLEGCKVKGRPFVASTVISAGTLTRGSIQKTFLKNVQDLSTVYRRGLARNPCLTGSVRVHVDTAATGRVTHVRLEFSNPELATLRSTLAQAIGQFRFEPTSKPSRFSYTLNLAPKQRHGKTP